MVFISYTHAQRTHRFYYIYAPHSSKPTYMRIFELRYRDCATQRIFFQTNSIFFIDMHAKKKYIRKNVLYMRVFLAIIIIRIFFVDFRKNYKSVYICRYIYWNCAAWIDGEIVEEIDFFLVMHRFNEIIFIYAI